MKLLRSLLYAAWLYGSMAVVGIGGAPFAAFHRPTGEAVIRLWARLAIAMLETICGVRVEVRGREHIPQGPALIASKHQATLDTILPFVLLANPAMVLKKELLKQPVFGWYAKQMGHISIDRDGHANALRAMLKEARAARQAGRQIFIFPEGTRQLPGAEPDYKPGVAALYRDLGLPCTPVALNTGLSWPPRGFLMTPGVVVIEFLPAIPPGLARGDFMAELQRRIETASDALLHDHAAAAATT